MKRTLLFLALLLGLTLPAMAQKHYSEIDFPALPNFDVPEAERVELPNGMILFLIEDHELPLVSMSARIGAGSLWEPADKVGLASVTGTVMRTGGTESMPGDEMNEMLEGIGASVETSIGESSGSAFMSSLTETVDEVLPVFADVLMNPAFPEDKIELAKTQQKSGISRRNDNSQQIAFREFDQLLNGEESPYARTTEYATIDNISRDDLVAFHDQFYHPNNVILGVWGDFDTETMVEKIQAAFVDWPKEEGFTRPTPPPINASTTAGVFYAPKQDVTQSTVLLGHPGEVTLDHPDYFSLEVMNEILSGGFSSRLFQNVRDDQGLAYSVFGGYSAGYEVPGRFFAGVMTKSETTTEAAKSVLHEVEKMRAAPPTDEEMSLAKDSYLNSFVFNFDTRREIVGRMMTYEYYDYPMDYLEEEKEGIENTSAADVQRVAQEYLKPDQMKILAVGNSDDFGAPLSDLGPVTEIDITIPTGEEPMPEATEETLSEGRALLDQAVANLGGADAFVRIESIRQVGESVSTTPDNQQTSISLESLIVFPDRARLVQKLPMGEISIVKNGDEMTLFSPQGSMAAPPPIKQQITNAIWRELAYLFA
ncbi:MAG TPA: pitrilysin family protein, partial [Rhodothermales bacterium]|nr:pitrilysin family protein [Rhodothermales bacterium]